MKYNFLERAEQYAREHNDEIWFKNSYALFKLDHDPKQALRETLRFLYDAQVAHSLEMNNE